MSDACCGDRCTDSSLFGSVSLSLLSPSLSLYSQLALCVCVSDCLVTPVPPNSSPDVRLESAARRSVLFPLSVSSRPTLTLVGLFHYTHSLHSLKCARPPPSPSSRPPPASDPSRPCPTRTATRKTLAAISTTTWPVAAPSTTSRRKSPVAGWHARRGDPLRRTASRRTSRPPFGGQRQAGSDPAATTSGAGKPYSSPSSETAIDSSPAATTP